MTAVGAMKRLPAWEKPRQWARTAWATADAKTTWEPRVARITKALDVIELETVAHRLRPSALVFRAPPELIDLSRWANERGLSVLPLAIEAASRAAYTSESSAPVPGQPIRFRTVVTSDSAGWNCDLTDETAIGRLLGYPECCAAFFQRAWVEDRWRDTTYSMSLTGTDGPPEASILLRWLGVRLVRHLPCSFGCDETARIGRETFDLGVRLGFADEMTWAREMLSWNVEWTSLHGIAEIKTPVLKISASTDPLADRAVVQKAGSVYPEEGVTGLGFPFVQLPRRKVTESKSFARSVGGLAAPDEWTENGFSSRDAMTIAHDFVLGAVRTLARPLASVLDLGCGNGLLLERIREIHGAVSVHGVEIDKGRAMSAYSRLGDGFIYPGSIADLALWPDAYDLILFMPGRLGEMESADRAAVVQQIQKASHILLYSYSSAIEIDRHVAAGYRHVYEAEGNGTSVILFEREPQ